MAEELSMREGHKDLLKSDITGKENRMEQAHQIVRSIREATKPLNDVLGG